ncbi:SDR family NAD(P)-dependent oxidoreductase [Halocalculus aciditolerans]|uniref:Beta-ketoacyl-ACP reductase n=1 Tax=Halocalculus aciditolerans TaxID=1383812 RepID=A0A830FL70_9EURY|nr:SDR family NAD(P)-dependent oxidoreductase [Halocalculus aciditolerans]GGL63492.1 beta-ketoacyl-ACP reductase [Halocalculus aciditolerans]
MNVVVTGGTGAIGRAVVESVADEPAVFSYQTREDAAAELAAKTTGESAPTTAHPLDVTDTESVEAFVDAAADDLGSVDAVVHTVGTVDPAPPDALDDERWERVLDTNLTGAFRVARATLPALRASGGSLVFLSSIGGTAGTVDPAYAASKAGLHGLVRSLAREAGPDGVRVNAVVPGPVDSPMNDDIVDYLGEREFHGHENVDTHLPTYACEPAAVADAVTYLVDGDYVHGELLNVNGGMQFR